MPLAAVGRPRWSSSWARGTGLCSSKPPLIKHRHPVCPRPAPTPSPEMALLELSQKPDPQALPGPVGGWGETELGRAAGGIGALGGGTPGSASQPSRTAPCPLRGCPQPSPTTAWTLINYSQRLYFRGESPVVGGHTTHVFKAKMQRRGWTGARESSFLLSWRDGLWRGARKNKQAGPPSSPASLTLNQTR